MATFHGNSGSIAVGSNAIAEVRSFSVTETIDTVDDTAIGDATRSFKTGHKSWTATVEMMWDDTDADGQETALIGTSITVNLYPEGTGGNADKMSGTAIVTEVGTAVAMEELVTRSISLQGSGLLTHATV